jgi:hypothetical protein
MAVLIIKATTVALIGAIAAVAAAIVSFCIWATPWVRRLSGRDLVRTLRTEGVSLVIDRAGPGTLNHAGFCVDKIPSKPARLSDSFE